MQSHNILDSNSLPANIELELDQWIWIEKALRDLKDSIQLQLVIIDEIKLPRLYHRESDEYYFFGYKRC